MTEQAVLEYLANSIWQVPMLAAVAWLLIWSSRPGARTQHRIWLATMTLAVILPFRGIGATTPNKPASQSAAVQGMQTAGAARGDLAVVSRRSAARNGEKQVSLPEDLSGLPMRSVRLSQGAAYWLVGLYLFAIFFRLMQLIYAWRNARGLVMCARPAALSQPVRAMLEDFCEKLDVRMPRLLVSGDAISPITAGVVRPVLLLPEDFGENTHSEIEAILSHELAHVRRRDYLMNLLCQAGALPIAYHPATHAMQRRVRQTREMVCDDMAADAMCSASGYARCLIALAQRMLHGRETAEQAQAVGLFDKNVLEERIMRLLETKTTVSMRARVARVTAGVVFMTAGVAAAAIFHLTPTVVRAATVNVPAVSPTATESLGVNPIQAATPAPAIRPEADAQTAPIPPAAPVKIRQADPQPDRDGVVVQNNEHGRLTPQERAQLKKDMDAATAQIRAETKKLQSPEFKKQMEDMQRQIAEATKKFQSDQVQRQMRMMQSPEFKKQMEDAQQQIAEAAKKFQSDQVQRQMRMMQSPEFKKQMEDAQQQIAEAAKKFQSDQVQRQMRMMQSPEFKKQMEDAQRQMAEAAKKMRSAEVQRQMKMLQSPEFKKQMRDMQQKIAEAAKKLQSDQMQREMQQLQIPDLNKQPENTPQ